MKNLYLRIREILFLRKALREDIQIHNWRNVTYVAFNKYKKSPQWERNLIAAFIKKYRQKYPYEIKGWSENEKLYKEYFTLDSAEAFSSIKSLEEVKEKLDKGDVYVTMFRPNSYYKGEKEFQYSSVWTPLSKPIVYKILDYREKLNYFRLGDNSWINLDREWMTAFRYSTEQEIEYYKAEKARQKEIDKQIKEKQKELSELYKKR